jgi:hypothetical protein
MQRQQPNNEDDLSDCGDGEEDDVSQYQNTLFGDMQSNAELKSSLGSRRYSGDAGSEDVKQS